MRKIPVWEFDEKIEYMCYFLTAKGTRNTTETNMHYFNIVDGKRYKSSLIPYPTMVLMMTMENHEQTKELFQPHLCMYHMNDIYLGRWLKSEQSWFRKMLQGWHEGQTPVKLVQIWKKRDLVVNKCRSWVMSGESG